MRQCAFIEAHGTAHTQHALTTSNPDASSPTTREGHPVIADNKRERFGLPIVRIVHQVFDASSSDPAAEVCCAYCRRLHTPRRARTPDGRQMTFTRAQLLVVARLVEDLATSRCIAGRPVPRDVLEIRRLLRGALFSSSLGTESDGAAAELDGEDLIGPGQAAEILGCTPRWARKIHADLDGRRCGSQWVFRRQTVAEYARAKDTNGRSGSGTSRGFPIPPRPG